MKCKSVAGMIVAVLFFAASVLSQDYRDVTRASRVALPGDLYYQDGFRVQWWYFTGHLYDDSGREFGYELTFFTVHVQERKYESEFGVNRIYISHFALSDLSRNAFLFSDQADTDAYELGGAKRDALKVWVGRNLLEGDMRRMHIRAAGRETALDLYLEPAKPVVLHGDKGYSRKSEESPLFASLYFSLPNLKTDGSITLGGKRFKVRGKSWFDRELSSQGLSKDQQGWDWFALQLDDGREIMLYLIRKRDGVVDRFSSGTFVYADGRYRGLAKDDFRVAVLDRYRSKKTGARYPSRWGIAIPSENLRLRITPSMQDQEVIAYGTTGNHYWEGTCEVEGTVTGRAYVEMTGY
ncbi:MAG: lipocalin-like domain-containing protein [Nitrospirota bacterium]